MAVQSDFQVGGDSIRRLSSGGVSVGCGRTWLSGGARRGKDGVGR